MHTELVSSPDRGIGEETIYELNPALFTWPSMHAKVAAQLFGVDLVSGHSCKLSMSFSATIRSL